MVSRGISRGAAPRRQMHPLANKCTKLSWCKGDIQINCKGQSEGVMTVFFALHLTLGRKIGHLQTC